MSHNLKIIIISNLILICIACLFGYLLFRIADDYDKNVQIYAKIYNNKLEKIHKHYSGKHMLMKIVSNNCNVKKSTASFFILSGKYTSNENIEKLITISWLGNDSIYNIDQFPITKIKIKINNNIDNPYMKFNYKVDGYNYNVNINYIIITCKESDWNLDLNINSIVESEK